ncbi:hypothetical protein, partial [Escherichia coli]|uniref:hypothetical protein n=1 Tax=Escherichia coli TaxID=562 RepID=UPI0022837A86
NGGKNSLNRLIRCVCGKKIGPDPRNFNQRVSLGRNDLLIRTFPKYLKKVITSQTQEIITQECNIKIQILIFGNKEVVGLFQYL